MNRTPYRLPWLDLIGLALLGALAYAIAWGTAPQNRATRDKIITTLKTAL